MSHCSLRLIHKMQGLTKWYLCSEQINFRNFVGGYFLCIRNPKTELDSGKVNCICILNDPLPVLDVNHKHVTDGGPRSSLCQTYCSPVEQKH